jgi:membrane peptidoglycan carboxypeptidase
VEAASQTYFHKHAKDLDILESAILASIPKSPVKYDPLRNRRNNL